MNGYIKGLLKQVLFQVLFTIYKFCTRLGIHVLPVHHYSPVPNILELEETRNLWAKKSKMPGVSIDLDAQAYNLRAVCMPYQNEYAGNKAYKAAVSNQFGIGYGYIEAQALHGVIRHYKPSKIVEVGGGTSTYCTTVALKMNENETNQSSQIICIEPYPSVRLKTLPGIKLIPKKVQTVSFEVLTELGEGDILFIDSSHAVRPGSDVNYLILEVLPRLSKGTIVHFHDIQFPYDYQRNTLHTFFHAMETSLLHAFLLFNNKAKIIFCLSHLHYERRNILRKVFPEYDPQSDTQGLRDKKFNPRQHFPSSIYFQIQ